MSAERNPPAPRQQGRDGKFLPGNKLGSLAKVPVLKRALTRAELIRRAGLSRRLFENGRGSGRWCDLRAGMAVDLERYIAWCRELPPAEQGAHWVALQQAHETLLRIEEEAGPSEKRPRPAATAPAASPSAVPPEDLERVRKFLAEGGAA